MRSISGLATTPRFLDPEHSPWGQFSGVNWAVLIAMLLLTGIGLVTVRSASADLTIDYFPRQAIWVGLGLLAFAVTVSIEYAVLVDLALPLYGLGCFFLVLVLMVGQVRGGAQSWLGFGPIGFQPSEFAKLATALLLARFLASVNRRVLTTRDLAFAVGIVALPVGLVVVEPDMGGAAMFMPMLAGMLLVGGVRFKLWLLGIATVVALGAGIWFYGMHDYQRERVLTFLNPGTDPRGKGYQVRQSKIAVGSGELHGKGYMQGTQSKLRFLPARHTDFIFAVLAEEWGFLGVVTVLFLYAVFIVNGARIAMRARDREGILLVVGLLSIISFHILYNTAMVIGLVPITGIPLPFLSYGGTFMLFNFAATGLILGIDIRRYVNR